MNVIRKAHRNHLLFWLLAITVALRALIAPGYMLEVNGDGPLGLGVVFCDGINSLTQIDPAKDPHALHHQHGSDNTNKNANNGMAGETCGLWSTSSTFVETLSFVSDHLVPVGPDEYVIPASSFITAVYRQQPQQPRAPPVSLIS